MRKIMAIICSILMISQTIFATELTQISAASAIVIEMNSQRILYNKNSDSKMPMASTTKIMTAIVALDSGKIKDTVTISKHAATTEGSSMYLTEGEKISMENLLYGLMLVSGNDAACAIAEYIAGDEIKFAEIMNAKAKEIGAVNTNFVTPHGLPNENHYSTSLDMAKITAYGLKNPKFAEIVATKTKKIPQDGKEYDRELHNHNKLLDSYDGCIGVKTGFTKAAGRCLVSAATKNGMTLICVTLNAPNDWNDHKILYDDMFTKYTGVKVMSITDECGEVFVSGGDKKTVDVIPKEEVYFPLAKGEKFTLNNHMKRELKAPLIRGDVVGYNSVGVEGEEFGMFELVAAKNVNMENFGFPKSKKTFQTYLQNVYRKWIGVYD
ncbi:MAG: D-alanyl-D-alanine carboxypeptidase family protein [Oscillospiraceae bacterium]